MPSKSVTRKKTYSPPKLNKPTSEQACLFLIGHAGVGHQGAKDLLRVLCPPFEPAGRSDVWTNFEEEEPARPALRLPWLIGGVLTVFQSTKEDFWRFVRG